MCRLTILTTMKVFHCYRRQSFDSMIALINALASALFSYLSRWIAVCLLSIVALPIYANPDAVIAECRTIALDQSGFIECVDLLEQDSQQSLESIESDWIEHFRTTADVAAADTEINKLLDTSVRYREYRDQHCSFMTSGLDSISMATSESACRVSMNRVRQTQLRRLLIEHRVKLGVGNFYRGFYLQTQNSALFQSCDLRQDWTVTADDQTSARLNERYEALTTEDLEIVYIEFRGVVSVTDTSDTVDAVTVNALSLIRPLLDNDCEPVVNGIVRANGEDDVVAEPDTESIDDNASGVPAPISPAATTDSTIDDLGDAGFEYGYFGAWTSLCAAQAQRVCKAQTTDTYSSEGDWQLVADRSADRNWRVRISPTTDSHVIGSQVQVAIDGNALLTAPVTGRQVLIGDAVTLASGERALQLLNSMRSGSSFELNWNTENQSNANLVFSLSGVSLALQYFDERGN